MASDPFWREVENSSAGNRKLGEILRRLEGFHGGSAPVDWEESRRRRIEAFSSCLATCDQSDRLGAILDGADFEVGGDEHHLVRVDAQPDRVFKLTHGDSFGCSSYFSPFDPDLTGRHFHGSINEDPGFYLRRWMLLNSLSGYQTRYEGLLPSAENLHLPRNLREPRPSIRGARVPGTSGKASRIMAMSGSAKTRF